MPLSHIIVTPLPNGTFTSVGAVKGRLSVHLEPRLREPGQLKTYPDWRAWPSLVNTQPLAFRVRVNGVVAAHTVVSGAPNQQAWRAIFGNPTTTALRVVPYTFVDRSNATLVSADPVPLADAVDALFVGLAGSLGGKAPTAGDLSGNGVDAIVGPGGALGPVAATYAPIGDGVAPPEETPEFHATLAQLGAHPGLLRALGLVFDLEVTLPSTYTVVTVELLNSGLVAVPMRTRVSTQWRPLAQDPTARAGGFLMLSDSERYGISTLDLPATVQRVGVLGDDLEGAAPEDNVSVPAAQEGGVLLLHRRMAEYFTARFDRQVEVEAGIDQFILGAVTSAPDVFAEDVTVGHRYDVKRDDESFRSLFQRELPFGYEFPRAPTLVVGAPDDEGWHSLALLADGDDDVKGGTSPIKYGEEQIRKRVGVDETVWRVPDIMFQWTGWSAAAGKPGQMLDEAGNAVPVPPSKPEPGDLVQFVAEYEVVPKTLPKLRYSSTYRLRARCVDLAGNSVALSASSPSGADSPEVLYGRLSACPPPLVVRRSGVANPGVGDTLGTLVIKSDLGQALGTVPVTDRLFFPPSDAQPRVEVHNLPAGGVNPSSYGMLVARDAVSIDDQVVIDPVSGDPVAGTLAGGVVTPGPVAPAVDYLVDPTAQNASFFGLPGLAAGGVRSAAFGPGWPDRKAARLVLKAGSGPPTVNTTTLTVTALLSQGRVRDIEVSCGLVPARLDHFGWFARLSAAAQAANEARLHNGRHAIFGDRALLRLVHAVRQPLLPPEMVTLTGTRTGAGSTVATVAGQIGLDRPSSGSVVLRGHWVDPVDEPDQPGPGTKTRRAVVGTVEVPYSGPVATFDYSDVTFDLRDTKRHLLVVDGEAISRYSDYFTEEVEITFATATASVVLDPSGIIESSVVVTGPNGRVFVAGTDYAVAPAQGRITRRAGSAIGVGNVMTARFIPRPVNRLSSELSEGAEVEVDLPATVAPVLPEIEAVLPAFARLTTATPTTISVVHDAQVLRVLVRRPWYSSGPGELLGVALDKTNAAVPSLTRFGRDPINPGTGVVGKPALTNFPRRVAGGANIDGLFHVAGHELTYDQDRQVWLVDIEINRSMGYRPFVQLALCRYQPLAVAGQHVSAAVLPDAVRLGASRNISVTKGTGQVTVTLTGADRVNQMQVIVQHADPTIADPDLRWQDIGSPTTLTRSGTRANSTHTAAVPVAASVNLRRLLIEDREPVAEADGATTALTYELAYREIVDLPADW